MKLPIAQIVEGHVKEALNLDQDISETRLNICRKCPLYSYSLSGTCNSHMWLNPKTNEVSVTAREGFIHGCGCRLQAKTRVLQAHCPVDKW